MIILKILMGIMLVMFATFFVALFVHIVKVIYKRTLKNEIKKDFAILIEKEYEDEYSTWGDLTEQDAQRYDVCLRYQGREYWFDSQEIYTNYQIGEKVPISVKNSYNKKGILKHTEIEA